MWPQTLELMETIITPSFLFQSEVAHELCTYYDSKSVPVPAINLAFDYLFAAYLLIPNSQLQYTTVDVYDHDTDQVLYHSIY